MMKKKILMVCYGGGHVKVIAPMYEKLCRQYDVKVLALTSAAPYLTSLGIPYVSFKSFESILPSDAIDYGLNLVQGLGDNLSLDYDESITYLGCSFSDLVYKHGEEKAWQLYREKARAAFYPRRTLKRIVENINPDLVLTTNAPRAERAALDVANELSIPTICINDNLWITGGATEVVRQGFADVVCVLSNEVKNALLEIDPQANVMVTGTPVFDPLKELAKTKLKTNTPTILLADCDLPEKHPFYSDVTAAPNFDRDVRRELNRLAEDRGWKVIFRPHPNQEYDYSSYPNIEVSEKQESVANALLKSDVVITAVSTVGIEGKAMGLGLVSLEGTVYGKENSYYKLGLSSPVYSVSDLESSIETELKKVNSIGCNLYNGLALENIASYVDKLLTLC